MGKDPPEAAARRQRKEAELNALNNGVSVLPENGDSHPSVATAVARFLEKVELRTASSGGEHQIAGLVCFF